MLLTQWIPMPNFIKNRSISGDKLLTCRQRNRKNYVADYLLGDEIRFLHKTCFLSTL
jgi:hypothetical protein